MLITWVKTFKNQARKLEKGNITKVKSNMIYNEKRVKGDSG